MRRVANPRADPSWLLFFGSRLIFYYAIVVFALSFNQWMYIGMTGSYLDMVWGLLSKLIGLRDPTFGM